MNQPLPPTPPPVADLAAPGLTVALRLDASGVVVAREAVTAADLADAKAETWRDHALRRGLVEVRLGPFDPRVVPVPSADGTRCQGFALEAELPSAEPAIARSAFSVLALEPVARRAEARLRQADLLQPGQQYYYEIEPGPERPPAPAPDSPGCDLGDCEITFQDPPLRFLRQRLAPLLERARPLGKGIPGQFTVFFTEEAFADAEHFARQGADSDPPVESGAALAGFLGSCPDSGEFFVVVTKALEVTGARADAGSLEYSGLSWTRIQAAVRALQAAEPAFQLLGQGHGHGRATLPNDGVTCKDCPNKPVCTLDNVFASADDQAWTRAVFAGQPWSLCLVFGLTARGDRVHGLFTLADARLQRRELLLLPGHDTAGHPVLSVPR
jgi:hypothetical protein